MGTNHILQIFENKYPHLQRIEDKDIEYQLHIVMPTAFIFRNIKMNTVEVHNVLLINLGQYESLLMQEKYVTPKIWIDIRKFSTKNYNIIANIKSNEFYKWKERDEQAEFRKQLVMEKIRYKMLNK